MFFLHFKSYLKQYNWKRGVDLSEGLWPLRLCPLSGPGSVRVRGRLWCCSCSQLCCTAPRTKCLPRLFLLMLLPIQTRQSFGLTKPPVSQMIFFSTNVKIFQAERVVLFFFFFLKCSYWRNYNVVEHHSHMYSHHQGLTGKGAGRLGRQI